ncbi:hypothetical protein Dda_8846 [Drechslerella dactyloides]|uniref:F-box domain-containing protein n=1 Tax=Drechslerella dactyloides TaxID=74499 RepID=A0AAD6IQ74_DREDA|nr:hypothetical protein Dda_8846 [Drechslerella dactyloides]
MSTQYRPFNHIPLELLQPIFQNLRRWELVPVALTCRSFNDAARRLLWADCDLTLFAKSPRPKNSNLFHAVESRQWDDVRLRLNSFSKEPMGGLVRSLTLRLKSFDQENDEDNDSDPENDPDHQQFQDQIQMARKMAKDIAEEPSALRSLYVDISFLDTPSDFAENLQYLQLELMDFYCYLHGYLRRTPRLECFCLFIDRTNPMIQTSPLRSIAPMFPEDIESVAGSLFIPTMRRLELTLSQGFLASTFLLYPGARTGEKKQLPVEQLFRNFALRHTDVIERFLWFSVEESLPESAGYRPRRSIPILNGATHMTIDRPCERKGRKNLRELRKSHNEKLRSLRLAHFMFEVDETGWLIENVLPFRNLVKLKLHDWWATDDIASAVMGIPTCGDSFLGHYSMWLVQRNNESGVYQLKALGAPTGIGRYGQGPVAFLKEDMARELGWEIESVGGYSRNIFKIKVPNSDLYWHVGNYTTFSGHKIELRKASGESEQIFHFMAADADDGHCFEEGVRDRNSEDKLASAISIEHA